MSSKSDYSKKILKELVQKPAISVPELIERISPHTSGKKPLYAISRSIRGLQEAGLLQKISSGISDYAHLTKKGRKKVHSINLDHEKNLLSPSWDGKWRIVMLDLPERRKDERDALRYLLKKAGFVCLKNAVWISPFPYEYFFTNIKKDFGLTTELMIFTTNSLDPQTEKVFFEMVK
jgi:phenylacetic acid degradation operon negative regulatory protein